MQWVASGFLFVRGRSVIHRLDPRARLFLTGAIFIVSLISHIVVLASLITLVIVLTFLAKIIKRFGKSMTFAMPLVALAFLLDYFVWPLGLVGATTYALRLFAVIASSSLFFLTTTPDELEQVMRWFHLPSDFVMVFVIAVRFVPVLLLDALQIMDAQRSRGLEFEKGNILKRLRNTIPILVPLIAVAVNRSLDLAEAMDSRAYGATKRPTSLYVLEYKFSDYFTTVVVAISSFLGIYVALFVHLI
ncbi:MAG: energy-coupling factor transporter transmembrane component T [archaeon]|nr:energy-coupling factor transporter transmembrane component T [archaeon]